MKKKTVVKEVVFDDDDFEGKWYNLNSKIKLLIRPFPMSEQTATQIQPLMLEQFKYCLIDWEGIKNKDDTKKLVNDDNKAKLYNHYRAIREFVIVKSRFDDGLDLDDLGN